MSSAGVKVATVDSLGPFVSTEARPSPVSGGRNGGGATTAYQQRFHVGANGHFVGFYDNAWRWKCSSCGIRSLCTFPTETEALRYGSKHVCRGR